MASRDQEAQNNASRDYLLVATSWLQPASCDQHIRNQLVDYPGYYHGRDFRFRYDGNF